MLKNPLLQKALAGIEQGVADRSVHDKVVTAGTEVMYDKAIFAELTKNLDPDDDLIAQAAGAVLLVMSGLAEKARGTLKPQDVLTAGMALLFDAVDFLEQAGMLKVDESTLDDVTSTFLNLALPKLGMPAEKMNEMLGSVKETMSNPERMAQYQQSRGGANGAT